MTPGVINATSIKDSDLARIAMSSIDQALKQKLMVKHPCV
jgi:hypothetical protein